jgi:hypothetical protein
VANMVATEQYKENTKQLMAVERLVGKFIISICLMMILLFLLLWGTTVLFISLLHIAVCLLVILLIILKFFSFQDLTVTDHCILPPEKPTHYTLLFREYAIPLNQIERVKVCFHPTSWTFAIYFNQRKKTNRSFVTIWKKHIVDLESFLEALQKRGVVVDVIEANDPDQKRVYCGK